MEHFFVVWNPKRGNPIYKHSTRELAKAEAERLCKENPQFEFFVLEAVGCYANMPITKPEWIEVINLPF